MADSRPSSVVQLRPAPTEPPPLRDRDDEALMDLAAGGHKGAFEALAERYLPRVTRFCVKFLGSARAGEDVAQEVLLEAWLQRQRYRDRGRFQVFLFTVARNRCLNAARAEGRRFRWLLPTATDEAVPPEVAAEETRDQLELLLERERQRQVRERLLRLPARHREAVLLRFDQGLGYAEIARIVGRPEGTIRSRVFHALGRLRDGLDGEDES